MSADDKIISASELNVQSDIKYAKPRVNKSGGKSIAILNAETGKQLYLSTPLMLTWGVEEYVDEASGRRSYSMNLQFPRDEYRTEETDAFLENIKTLHERIRNDAVKYSREWLNKSKMTLDVVDALMNPLLRYPKDPDTGEPDLTRAPTLKVKLDYWDESFNCEIYDLQQQMLFPPSDGSDNGPMQLIPKGTNTAVVMRCGGIWLAGGKFGMTWRLLQAVVKPRANLKGKCHIKLSATETERLKAQADEDEDDAVGVEIAEDSDEDDDVSDAGDNGPSFAEAPAPAPAPAPEPEVKAATKTKKKVVKRKVKRKVTAEKVDAE